MLPRVHRVISLLKRWLLGTHRGAISHEHLNDYLDELTFRFNRRTSASQRDQHPKRLAPQRRLVSGVLKTASRDNVIEASALRDSVPARGFLAFAPGYVAVSIAHFICFEVGNLIQTL